MTGPHRPGPQISGEHRGTQPYGTHGRLPRAASNPWRRSSRTALARSLSWISPSPVRDASPMGSQRDMMQGYTAPSGITASEPSAQWPQS